MNPNMWFSISGREPRIEENRGWVGVWRANVQV
jgi:hypothetical protein